MSITPAKAAGYLLSATAIWGMTFPLIRNAVIHINPYAFVGIRFLLAGLIFIPWLLIRGRLSSQGNSADNFDTSSNARGALLRTGLLLGILNGASYTAQTIGLQTVNSARAAFITGFSVILVPFLAPLFKQSKPTHLDIICSLVCLSGLYILTGANFQHINQGDIWILAASVFFAVAIVYLHKVTQVLHNYRLLTFYQILFTAPLPLLLADYHNIRALTEAQVILAILFCSLAATNLALFLQTKYQKFISAPKAALIFATEPLFATLFGWMINGEPITSHILWGGLLIFTSLSLPSLLQLMRR